MRNLECPQHALGEQLVRRQAGDILAIEDHAAGGRAVKPGNNIEKGCLAGAIRADQSGDRSGLDGQRHIVDGLDSPEIFGKVFNGNHRAPFTL